LNNTPKKSKSPLKRDTCTHSFIAALFTITKLWHQPKCPSTDKWIKKMWNIYTMEYYSAKTGILMHVIYWERALGYEGRRKGDKSWLSCNVVSEPGLC
jgi:hypothetical protein